MKVDMEDSIRCLLLSVAMTACYQNRQPSPVPTPGPEALLSISRTFVGNIRDGNLAGAKALAGGHFDVGGFARYLRLQPKLMEAWDGAIRVLEVTSGNDNPSTGEVIAVFELPVRVHADWCYPDERNDRMQFGFAYRKGRWMIVNASGPDLC